MKRIILITGGSRSGKSTYAEKLALSLSSTPVYLATARIWDEEFRKRVIHHQARRGPEWTNIEEEKELSRHALSGRTILIDCITLWCTNFFFDLKADTDQALTAAKEEFDVNCNNCAEDGIYHPEELATTVAVVSFHFSKTVRAG